MLNFAINLAVFCITIHPPSKVRADKLSTNQLTYIHANQFKLKGLELCAFA